MKKKHSTKLHEYQNRARSGLEICKCGEKATTVDHIIPVWMLELLLQVDSAYDDDENFELMCGTCNRFLKSSRLDYYNPKTAILLKKYIDRFSELSKNIVEKRFSNQPYGKVKL